MFINLVWLAYILQIKTKQETIQNAFSLDTFLFLNISMIVRKAVRRQRRENMSIIVSKSRYYL